MRICILSRDNVPIGYLDNDVPDGMHYYDDKLHVYLTGTAHTFEFATRATEESAELLAVGNKLAFIYKDRPYYLNIVTTSQDEDEIEVEAWAFCLELLNETANAYEGTSKTFMEYFNGMIFANDMFEIGINEVSTRKRTLSYTSTSDTLLKRLYSLVEAFGAEVEFIPELNPDYSLNKILVNVYQEHSDTVQGVGERRTDANYRYGKGVDGITKKQDITNLYTSIRPTGKDNLKITDVASAQVLDDDGNVLYYHTKGSDLICAPQAMEQFPSYVGAKDKYIAYNWETNYETQADLYGHALAKLKEISVPDSSYEIKGSIDVNIGDTITVIDESFSPALYLETRVTEQEISFTDTTRNSTTFESTKELESAIDSALTKRVAELETQTAKISTKADEAVVKADSASETATNAATKADEASTTASKAQETATSAQTAATNAETKATEAASSASSAQASASSAQASASSAQTSASSAQTQAETANTAAQASASSASTASAQATASAKSASEATAAANSSVVSSVTEYYLSTSATSQTGGSWSTTSPTWSEGTYVWTRTKTTTKGGTISYSNAACVTGNTGAQGTSVTKTYTQYYLSTSNTTQTGGSWSNTMPTWASGKYIWQREITVLSTGSTVTGTAVLASGLNSANQTASTANSNASSAVSAANTANTNASNAVTTANTANSTANAASTTAANAQTTANTAKTTADTAKTTADTAKAATDTLNTLIRETTDGVEVAKVDDTGAYTGMRTEQTADAYLIKDKDGTTLASYGADTVELGKNSLSSKILLCNGAAQISAEKKEETGITFNETTFLFPEGTFNLVASTEGRSNGLYVTIDSYGTEIEMSAGGSSLALSSSSDSAISFLDINKFNFYYADGTNIEHYDSCATSDVAVALDLLSNYPNAGNHNSIFRGQYLGSEVTSAQYAEIEAGTFKDLYIGDYWTINSTNYRIAAFDYFWGKGATVCSTHHAVIVPDHSFYSAQMNTSATTSGGYVGSNMKKSGLTSAYNTVKTAFGGTDHLLAISLYMCNAVSSGKESGYTSSNVRLELMTEAMLLGRSTNNSPFEGSTQLPLFALAPNLIMDWPSGGRWAQWLQDVASASAFRSITYSGSALAQSATTSCGVRPFFCLCG